MVTNYLPAINGQCNDYSIDSMIPWSYGHQANGYIYQKEYIEFFIHIGHLSFLQSLLLDIDHDEISFMLCNRDASIRLTNWSSSAEQFPLVITWIKFISKYIFYCFFSFQNKN